MNRIGRTEIEPSEDDIRAARQMGASGTQVYEAAIHTALDRQGVPRDGRVVKVTSETIEIKLPKGWVVDD